MKYYVVKEEGEDFGEVLNFPVYAYENEAINQAVKLSEKTEKIYAVYVYELIGLTKRNAYAFKKIEHK